MDELAGKIDMQSQRLSNLTIHYGNVNEESEGAFEHDMMWTHPDMTEESLQSQAQLPKRRRLSQTLPEPISKRSRTSEPVNEQQQAADESSPLFVTLPERAAQCNSAKQDANDTSLVAPNNDEQGNTGRLTRAKWRSGIGELLAPIDGITKTRYLDNFRISKH